MTVKQIDQRSHAERRYDCADAHKARDPSYGSATQEIHSNAADDAQKIRCDPDGPEFAESPSVHANQRNCIVCGNAHIGGHIQGGAEAQKYKAKEECGGPDEQAGGREDRRDDRLGEVDHITQQKQVDEGGDADIVPVENQGEQEQRGLCPLE